MTFIIAIKASEMTKSIEKVKIHKNKFKLIISIKIESLMIDFEKVN